MNVDSLRHVLIQRARTDADAIIAAAESEARRRREAATLRVATVIDQARRDGESAARREAALDLRAARRQARAAVLAAQHDAEQRLRHDVAVAAIGLRDDPAYATLLTALTRIARERLGGHASIVLDPPGRGGIIAREGTRRLDLTLASLALLALDTAAAPPETTERGAVA